MTFIFVLHYKLFVLLASIFSCVFVRVMPTVLTFKKLTEGSQNKFKVVQRVEEIRMKTTNYVKKKQKQQHYFKVKCIRADLPSDD